MKRYRKLLATITLALTSLLMQACRDDNPSQPTAPSVVGTWNLISANGQDASALGGVWTFGQTQSTYSQVALGCTGIFNYTTSGNKITLTIVQDGCGDNPAGSTSDVTYSISGNRLTMTYDSDVLVFEKETSATPLIGRWQVLTIDGQAPRNTVVYGIAKSMIYQTANIDGSVCTTGFSYTKNGNKLNITTVADECEVIEVGTTDIITYTVSGNRLTLVFSDGTTVVTQKI